MSAINQVAPDVAAQLLQAETAVDQAVLALSKLPAVIHAAGTMAALQFGETQGPLASVAEALGLLVQSRARVAQTHQRLRDVGDRHGFDPVSVGDIFAYPAEALRANVVEAPKVQLAIAA